MEFVKFNANPKNWRTGDCVVRAISSATDMSWQVVYRMLCEIGEAKCRMPNDKIVYEALLKKLGWEKQKMPRHDNGTRWTVREFIDDMPPYFNGKGMIVSVANHLTYTRGGELIDTWDCSRKCVGNWWIKK